MNKMKILVIGGTGTLGSALVSTLKENHEVISVGRTKGDYQVNIEDKASLEKLLGEIGEVDGIISTCGDGRMAPFQTQSDNDIDLAINSKLRGQLDIIRLGVHTVKENGFILITTGTASLNYMPGASSITMANTALEGYVKAIHVEPYKGIRINAVSPYFIKETCELFNLDVPNAIPAVDTASVYVDMIGSPESGTIVDVTTALNK
jgi:NAD(P)-dependent dehydrogenase (short-subunit alcohol dehydrogenase family)